MSRYQLNFFALFSFVWCTKLKYTYDCIYWEKSGSKIIIVTFDILTTYFFSQVDHAALQAFHCFLNELNYPKCRGVYDFILEEVTKVIVIGVKCRNFEYENIVEFVKARTPVEWCKNVSIYVANVHIRFDLNMKMHTSIDYAMWHILYVQNEWTQFTSVFIRRSAQINLQVECIFYSRAWLHSCPFLHHSI